MMRAPKCMIIVAILSAVGYGQSTVAPPSTPGGAPGAPSDPIGGVSLLDAVEKRLGLKLEAHKRPAPVFVIDHIEETTDRELIWS